VEGPDVTELAVVRNRAARLLDALESQSAVTVKAEYADVAGTVARARSLVLSAVAMVDAGGTGAMGLVARAMFEEWLFGMLMIFGEAKDRTRLDADYQYWLERHALAFGREAPARPAGVTPRQWNVADRVQRLDVIRGDNFASDGYRRLYALESFATAHGGFGTANMHITETADGSPTVVWREKGTDSAVPDLFALVVQFAVDLIRAVWRESRLNLDPLVAAAS
jgi:hypothetical protein